MNSFLLFRFAGVLLTLILCLLTGVTFSQAQNIVDSRKAPCEGNSAWLDRLMQDVNESSERELVFVIARLGRGETSRYLTQRRLHNAKTYLGNRLRSEQIILAEGDRSPEEGRVEFYVGSKLLLVSLIGRGRDLCVNCFEPNPKDYGCGKNDRKRK